MSNHANLSWKMTHLTQGAPKKKKKKEQRHAINFVI